MRRLIAMVLAAALVTATAAAASLHVHEYAGHDHPEHHHGLAAHRHAAAAPPHADRRLDDHGPHFEAISCDAGRHAVTARTVCASVPSVEVAVAELPGPALAVPAAPARSALPITDVRVHGPPAPGRLPARAPPASLPA
ncbi:MAG TPA: hypothetical protein VFK57_05165 [Vicinamibacterales bacterium]|nr:hypothetical protein [Vicinamibacterales bacterium]